MNASIHVNGAKNVVLSTGTWSPSGSGTCSNVACHGTPPNSEVWR